jgi:hypothetical protein
MPPIALLSVVAEKEAHEVEDALNMLKRSLPVKVFSAHKAVNAVGQAQVSADRCRRSAELRSHQGGAQAPGPLPPAAGAHCFPPAPRADRRRPLLHTAQKAVQAYGDLPVALLHYKFTAAGKEEFSETLRKFLRDKCPNTVVVGWGSAKSGGKQGENYHTFIVGGRAHAGACAACVAAWGQSEAGYRRLLAPQDCHGDVDPQQLLAAVRNVMSGAIQPMWGKTGRASMDGKWVARQPRRKLAPGCTALLVGACGADPAARCRQHLSKVPRRPRPNNMQASEHGRAPQQPGRPPSGCARCCH